MKKLIIIIVAICFQLQNFLLAQPHPSDRGPGTPGGDPMGPPLGGAPIDDFTLGFIFLSLSYGIFKWYRYKAKQIP